MGKATIGWIAGCLTIWSSLFAIGNFLYGRYQLALILTARLRRQRRRSSSPSSTTCGTEHLRPPLTPDQ